MRISRSLFMCLLKKQLEIRVQLRKGSQGCATLGVEYIPCAVIKAVIMFSHQLTEPSFHFVSYDCVPDFSRHSKTEPLFFTTT